MSTNFPTRPEKFIEPARFAIVASEYNRDYVDRLLRYALDELNILAPQADTSLVRVPGSFEIPIAVQSVARYQDPDVILAFGVIFDGETVHASLIATAVTEALLDISLAREIPILHEVLVVKTDAQAKARCLLPEINRGTEAARAAVRILQTLREIRKGA